MVETATKQLGPIDILVHNAGGDIAAKGGKPDPNDAVGIREEDVRAVLDRNLLSTILTCQAVAKEMMARRQGRIVTIGSVAAFKGRTNGSIYAVAKAGMTHYTRCLADQLRSYDITVNCIAPGDTRTGRFMGTRAVDQNRMVETGTLDRIAPSTKSRASSKCSRGRWGRSCQARCCASMAADSAGRGERMDHAETDCCQSNPRQLPATPTFRLSRNSRPIAKARCSVLA